MINREKRLKIIKSNERGRRKLQEYWEERQAMQLEGRKKDKKILESLSAVKYQNIRMKILEAEEHSLNQY